MDEPLLDTEDRYWQCRTTFHGCSATTAVPRQEPMPCSGVHNVIQHVKLAPERSELAFDRTRVSAGSLYLFQFLDVLVQFSFNFRARFFERFATVFQ